MQDANQIDFENSKRESVSNEGRVSRIDDTNIRHRSIAREFRKKDNAADVCGRTCR